jgi:hypothetical protein
MRRLDLAPLFVAAVGVGFHSCVYEADVADMTRVSRWFEPESHNFIGL